MDHQLICARCGTVDNAGTVTPGSGWIELLLYLMFIIPGLIYSIWRISGRRKNCRVCGSADLVPVESPVGRKLAAEFAPPTVDPRPGSSGKGSAAYAFGRAMRNPFLAALAILGIVVVGSVFVAFAGADGSSTTASNTQAQPVETAKPAHPANEPRMSVPDDIYADMVRAHLRDPVSAVFRNTTVGTKNNVTAVCGEVNSRNGFGGMSGFTRYVMTDAITSFEGQQHFRTLWSRYCFDGRPAPEDGGAKGATGNKS